MEQSAYEFYLETWDKWEKSHGNVSPLDYDVNETVHAAINLKNRVFKYYFDRPGVLLFYPSLELCDSDGDDPVNHPWHPLCSGENPPTSAVPYDRSWLSNEEYYGIGIKCAAIGAPPYGDSWVNGTIYSHKVHSINGTNNDSWINGERFGNDAVDCTLAYWTHLVQTGTFYQVFKETGSWEECEGTIHGTCYWLVPTGKLESKGSE